MPLWKRARAGFRLPGERGVGRRLSEHLKIRPVEPSGDEDDGMDVADIRLVVVLSCDKLQLRAEAFFQLHNRPLGQ